MDFISRFEFKKVVPMKGIDQALKWATMQAESKHGQNLVLLDKDIAHTRDFRKVEIDRTTEVGQQIALAFMDTIRRSFGREAFRVVRLKLSEAKLLHRKHARRPKPATLQKSIGGIDGKRK